jgi:RNA polymerase sigma factor for flagellar operon FliA
MKKAKIEHLKLWKVLKSKKSTDAEKKEIKDQLIKIYYPLVKKIAGIVSKSLEWKVSVEELSSFGVDGLYIAVDKFSPNKGVKFPIYATIRIRGSMIDGIRREDLIPRSVRINYHKIEKIRSALENEKGRKVYDEEVADKAGISLKEFFRNGKKFAPAIFSSIDGSNIIDASKQEDFKQDSNDVLVDNKLSSPDSKILRKEFFNKLISKSFSHLEQKIIFMYYYQDLTMDVISEKLGLSESRISQIHADILQRLRDKISRNPSYFDSTIVDYIESCKDQGPLF